MPPKTPATPKVPGDTPAPVVEQPKAEETVVVSKSVLDEMMARIATLEAKKVTARNNAPETKLPDQDDIDLETLKNPLLTKQGWLVPEGYGSHPNGKKL